MVVAVADTIGWADNFAEELSTELARIEQVLHREREVVSELFRVSDEPSLML